VPAPLIFVYSRSAIGALQAPAEPHIVISISTTTGDPARLGHPAHPPSRLGLVRLAFYDSDTPAAGRVLFDRAMAARIWDLVEQHRSAAEIIRVHCDAGLSRSPGVAAALALVLHGDDREFFARYRPNRLVYRTMLDEAEARGLIGDLPPGRGLSGEG
jgi:predicted protein tyrosine phosphatase